MLIPLSPKQRSDGEEHIGTVSSRPAYISPNLILTTYLLGSVRIPWLLRHRPNIYLLSTDLPYQTQIGQKNQDGIDQRDRLHRTLSLHGWMRLVSPRYQLWWKAICMDVSTSDCANRRRRAVLGRARVLRVLCRSAPAHHATETVQEVEGSDHDLCHLLRRRNALL